MGMELEKLEEDDQKFRENIHDELEHLKNLLEKGYFNDELTEGGFELEYFLIDNNSKKPKSISLNFISQLEIGHAVPEFSDCSVETHTNHFRIGKDTLFSLNDDLYEIWQHCRQQAVRNGIELIMIGSLPTASSKDFTREHLTHTNRYIALENTSVERMPVPIHIEGRENLQVYPESLASMGSCCAFHIHFRIGYRKYARYYNAALALAGPILSVCCNSPILFQKTLWDESRIVFIEQLFQRVQPYGPYHSRTIFGEKYIESIVDLLEENNQFFSSVLPYPHEKARQQFWHLRLHGSTIYRWVRPVIGIQEDSTPHFRIEFRPLPSGPTHVDTIANGVFYLGLIHHFAEQPIPIEHFLPFELSKRNFYRAAKRGLSSRFTWLDNKDVSATELVSDLILAAKDGLKKMNVAPSDADFYLDIIKQRLSKNMNGAEWQRRYLKSHPHDFHGLIERYLHYQNANIPVHEWSL